MDDDEILFERLASVFGRDKVRHKVDFVGASNTAWSVSSVVRSGDKTTVFEPVSEHHASISAVFAKFADLAALESAPQRVAVVRKREALGTRLTLLASTAKVIEQSATDQTLLKLAA